MKKTLLIGLIALGSASVAEAGGLLNNTSLHALYLRNLARNASLSIDGAYYNPAGSVFARDGWRFSINSQTVLQERNIDATFAPFAFNGGEMTKTFKGKATAPVFPTFIATYKKDRWAFSGVASIFGGGGKANFDQGLPMFEGQVAAVPAIAQGLNSTISPLISRSTALSDDQKQMIGRLVNPVLGVNRYALDSQLEGLQYTFGLQLGATYRINKHLSAHLGARLSYAYNTYDGYIRGIQVNNTAGEMVSAPAYFTGVATALQSAGSQLGELVATLPAGSGMTPESIQNLLMLPVGFARSTMDRQIDVKQTGWGIAPIIGLNFNYDNLNIGARYEFRTAIDVKNETKVNSSGMARFDDGVKTANDMPAILAVGASYKFFDKLTASVGYNHFFEKDARMADNKQRDLDNDTNEYLVGLEWNALSWLDVSAGVQFTRKGVTDAYQSDLHFDMSSNSYGLGVGLHLSREIMLNLAYMISDYRTHSKSSANFAPIANLAMFVVPGSETYSRKNQIFSIGIDYTL